MMQDMPDPQTQVLSGSTCIEKEVRIVGGLQAKDLTRHLAFGVNRSRIMVETDVTQLSS